MQGPPCVHRTVAVRAHRPPCVLSFFNSFNIWRTTMGRSNRAIKPSLTQMRLASAVLRPHRTHGGRTMHTRSSYHFTVPAQPSPLRDLLQSYEHRTIIIQVLFSATKSQMTQVNRTATKGQRMNCDHSLKHTQANIVRGHYMRTNIIYNNYNVSAFFKLLYRI